MELSARDNIFKALRQLSNINPSDLDVLAQESQDKNRGLTKAIIRQGIMSDRDLLILFVRELRIPSIDLAKYRLDKALRELVPERFARQYCVVPIAGFADTLTVAVSDPLNEGVIDDLQVLTGKNIDIVLAAHAQVLETIDQLYGAVVPAPSALPDAVAHDISIVRKPSDEPLYDEASEEQAPVITLVNAVIKEAVARRASDIHMEPTAEGLRVRYRIDGILEEIRTIPAEQQNAVIVRVKILSRLDITSFQMPQDGRFKMRFPSGEIDFRVSLLPTTFGQKIVMRILDKNNLSVGLGRLGFSKRSVDLLEEAVTRPFGMILVTGPTGSGKSTTLYSLINKLNMPDRNIITIEDPVEYLIEGLTQIEVRQEIGFSFATGLRSVLRQSPDIVMVGEIRDNETADIAIKASLTGQLVLSTLHTNDAAGAVTRLVDMGLEPFLVASSLLLVCSQRLCRRICPHCKEPIEIPASVLERIRHRIKSDAVFYKGKGCAQCHQTGYLGRVGITEILQIDDRVRELLLQKESSAVIAAHAKAQQGMRLLFDDGLDKMCAGETTLEEVYRIASFEEE